MKKISTSTLAFMAICIALNFVGANTALLLRLPLYLDTFGTVTASIILGPWFGVLTAIISALLSWMTTDIFALYFSPVAIILALLTGYLVNTNSKPNSIWWKSLIISLSGTIVASIITVILFHGITSSGSSLIVQFLHGLGLDLVTSSVIVQALTDYADRLLTISASLLLIKRFHHQLKSFAPSKQ